MVGENMRHSPRLDFTGIQKLWGDIMSGHGVAGVASALKSRIRFVAGKILRRSSKRCTLRFFSETGSPAVFSMPDLRHRRFTANIGTGVEQLAPEYGFTVPTDRAWISIVSR